MKTYIVEVTLRGGFYAGQRRKFAVGPVEATGKNDAAQKAMDLIASDKTVGEYDSMHAGKIRLRKSSPSPTLARAKYSQGAGESQSQH